MYKIFCIHNVYCMHGVCVVCVCLYIKRMVIYRGHGELNYIKVLHVTFQVWLWMMNIMLFVLFRISEWCVFKKLAVPFPLKKPTKVKHKTQTQPYCFSSPLIFAQFYNFSFSVLFNTSDITNSFYTLNSDGRKIHLKTNQILLNCKLQNYRWHCHS